MFTCRRVMRFSVHTLLWREWRRAAADPPAGSENVVLHSPESGEKNNVQILSLSTIKGEKNKQKKHESWTGGITSTLLVYVPMVSLSLFWRHWGTKTVISLWPRLQNVSTASAMPRQEKTRWWPCLQKHCWYYNVSKYNKKSFSLFLWLRRWNISIIVLIFLYSDCRFVSCINFGQ